jgi:homoserine kinase
VDQTIAFGPASVANVGPFFDVMGYCLNHLGDFVEAKKVERSKGIVLKEIQGPYSAELKSHLDRGKAVNCVDVIAEAIWSEHKEKFDFGIELTLHKCMPVKSGLGSSAASCVAATRAILELINDKVTLTRVEKNNIMMRGEREVSGHYYPDNIVPSFWGGFHIISQDWQEAISPPDFHTVVFLNGQTSRDTEGRDVFVRDIADTGEKRNELYKFFDSFVNDRDIADGRKVDRFLNYLRFQSRNAARLVHALYAKDTRLVGEIISNQEDNFLFDARDRFTRRAAIWALVREAGGLGCAIAGSGPSIFVITNSSASATAIREAVTSADQFAHCFWLISRVNKTGSQIISSIEDFKAEHSANHNFWPPVK